MANHSFQSQKKFYDDKNFPRGFSRSGDFTLKEAEMLEAYGSACRQLSLENSEPQTAEEQHFVAVCRGEAEAETALERAWLKYVRLTGQRRFFTLFGSTKSSASSTPRSKSTIDDDDDTDIDIDEDIVDEDVA